MIRYLFLAFCFCVELLSAQCIINAKREACVNDLVNFSITVGSGSPVSYDWDFGVYGSSVNTAPLVKFTNKGTVVVSCVVTLSGGQTCKDTHEIKIYPGPLAKAGISGSSVFCFNNNKICLNDSNSIGFRGIKTVTLLWGDGGIDKFTAPIPKKWCYTYSDTGKFKIDFEIADSIGCKDKFTLNAVVFPSVKTLISSSEMLICDSTRICLKDSSQGLGSGKSQWYTVPGNKLVNKNKFWCTSIGPDKEIEFKLVSQNEYGCTDSANYQYQSQPSDFYVQQLDSEVCINELTNGKLLFYSGEDVEWYLNGSKEYTDKKYVAYRHALLGKNVITAKRIGGCKGTKTDTFVVIGVRASARVWNENRRKSEDTVFLIDLTKATGNSKLIRLWDFGDLNAPQCITWTAKGQNVGKNCNYSRDSIGRHFYADSNCYAARLLITDSVTGCFDDTLIPVYRRNACPEVFMPKIVCLGDYAGFSMPTNMSDKVKDKNYLFPDTTKPLDSIILYGGYARYLYKTIGYKSPILWRFYPNDTVWTEIGGKIVMKFIRKGAGWVADTFINKVRVVQKSNSEFTVKKIGECNPFIAELKFKDSIWNYPGTLSINWGDTLIVYSNWKDTIISLPVYRHTYKTGGFYSIEVIMTPKIGCPTTTIRSVAFSHLASFRFNAKCIKDAVCFVDSVVDLNSNIRWKSNNNMGKLYWNFGDGKTDSGYNICHKYANAGYYKVTLTAKAVGGCISIASDTVKLGKPFAAIQHQPTIYCSDIRQYFDSSYVPAPNNGQKIIQWIWDFGDGSSPVGVKNPAHIFPGGGVYNTRLIVKTNLGCSDTTNKTFTVIGPEIATSILTDSIGCAPLKVDFKNLSKNAKNFIWQFGDIKNTVYSTDRDTNTNFTYKEAGVYYVHIIGGDSFLNPTTGGKYYCSTRYPGPNQNQLRITVFESANALFNSPKTVCVGDSFLLENTSLNSKLKYFWDFGNADTATRRNDTFKYMYLAAGKYRISLKPVLKPGQQSPCADSAFQFVTVVKITPEFVQDCSQTIGSELVLKNKSGMDIPGFEWTLLNPMDSSEKRLSDQMHFRYDFGKDTGFKTICLGINGGKSCGGKTCKTMLVQGEVFFANVFTPGIQDGFNDSYKVPLIGYADFELKIFNRWGERVFITQNPKVEWNGLVENVGEQLPAGVYFYQVQYRPECSDKPLEVHGSITLIR